MARTVTVKIGADVGDLKAKLRDAGGAIKSFRGELDRAARGGHLDAVADQAAGVGLALVGAAGAAVKLAADFDKAMSSVRAATHAGARDMDRLRDAALQAGKDTSYSATEAAKAITELSKAGVATGDVLGGGLKGALSLAAAGQLDVAEAAETAASAMTQFKLKGADIPHIADLLAAAAGKAQGSVHDMGMALNQSGLVAAQMGINVEDTTGTLAAFASAGLLGSDAGTSLKTALLMLANPTDKARGLMKDLGINAYDATGKFVGMSGLAGQLQQKLGGLTQEQRNSALATIFGSDAIRAASVLYEQGSTGIQKWTDKVNDQGFAAETAKIQTDNLVGDLERLKGSLETLAIQSGSGANGGLRVLAKGAEAVVDEFSNLPPAVGGVVTVLAGISGAALLVGAGWVKVRRTTADALRELEATGPAGAKAASGLQSVSKWAGRAAAAFVAFEAARATIGAFQDDLNPQIEALAQGLDRFGASGELAGESARVLGGGLDKLTGTFKLLADTDNTRREWASGLQGALESIVPGLDGTETSLARTKERVAALDGSLSQLVQGGKTDEAKAAFERLAQTLATNGVTMDEFRAQFPQYAAALEVAKGQTADAATATGDLSSKLQDGVGAQKEYASVAEASAAAVHGERNALEQLADAMKAETDPVFGLLDAEKKLADAQKASAKAIKDHGRNSAEAKDATRDLALAALGLQGAVGKLGDSFDGEMTPALKATLKAAGLSERQIKDLSGQFRDAKKDGDKFASKYAAEVSLTGYEQVAGKLDRLAAYQQGLKAGTIKPGQYGPYKGADGKYFATGGWTGPGSKYEPVGIVHADEFVIRKESRQKVEREHPGLLDEMNATGQVRGRGYATGGRVSWPYKTTVAGTRIPSAAEVAAKVVADFGSWPSSPAASRGDSGVWHKIVALIKGSGIGSGSFGNAYRPGDPLWHGSGRAVDWMGYEQDELATFLAGKRPLELIHRTKSRDYAYTRGVNKGSFNNALMEAHRNHVHIAMANGGVIGEHVLGVGRSGRTYEFGERGPETVIPGYANGGLVNVAPKTTTSSTGFTPTGTRLDYLESLLSARGAVDALSASLKTNGRTWSFSTAKGRENRSALISGVKAAQQAAQAKYAETGSVKAANKVYDDYIKQLDTAMKRMGINAKTRKELLKVYSERPKYDLPEAPAPAAPSNSSATVKRLTDQMALEEQLSDAKKAFAWTKPTFNITTESGRAEMTQLFSFLSAAQQAAQSLFEAGGDAGYATNFYNGYLNQLRTILAAAGMSGTELDAMFTKYARMTLTQNRWGGLYSRAGGGLREAQIAAGGAPLYQWAEESTGGEAFIPRLGDRARSTAIWRHVGEQWLGQPVWRPGAAGAPSAGRNFTAEVTIPITLGADTITRQVRIEVDTVIGQVVDAAVYQTA